MEKEGGILKQYLSALEHIFKEGKDRKDRTGIGTRGIFGHQLRFDLRNSFPAVTTKKLAWRSVVSELLWFLEGETDERRLAEIHYGQSREELKEKKTIWTANADKQGKELGYKNTETIKELGPVYGNQWRSWKGKDKNVDQIKDVLKSLSQDPYSRRHIVSAWNVAEVDKMALPPCHSLFQFYVAEGKLSCQLYQRSADIFLGVPFNIASYALLTMMIAQVAELELGEFVHTFGDAHIYANHIEQVDKQLDRLPLPLPRMVLNPGVKDIFDFTYNDFTLTGYQSHQGIKAPIAV